MDSSCIIPPYTPNNIQGYGYELLNFCFWDVVLQRLWLLLRSRYNAFEGRLLNRRKWKWNICRRVEVLSAHRSLLVLDHCLSCGVRTRAQASSRSSHHRTSSGSASSSSSEAEPAHAKAAYNSGLLTLPCARIFRFGTCKMAAFYSSTNGEFQVRRFLQDIDS